MENTVRFEFGANWKQLEITTSRIEGALESLRSLFPSGLSGKSLLDIGCGSGLFSLAAATLGATVHSFDVDQQCVKCAEKLRASHAPNAAWTIERGSILDSRYVRRLGTFDVVYSWGVLHHTGDLQTACENVANLVGPGGCLIVAIYNDQGWRSRYWKAVKRWYCLRPALRPLITGLHFPMLAARCIVRLARGDIFLGRGMSLWRDYIDWIGGYPFEVASPQVVRSYFHEFRPTRFSPATSGCNEFVFMRER